MTGRLIERFYAVAIGLVAVVFLFALVQDTGAANTKTVIGPNANPQPTFTPRPDQHVQGVPELGSAPTCAAGEASTFADASGCIYACAGSKRVVLATALTAACTFPTATATATPTPTATAT